MGTLHKDLTLDNIHATVSRVYNDITARDADSDFNTAITNLNKMVRVDSPVSYYILSSITPTWTEASSTATDEWTELDDVPSSISANLVVQGNSGGTALEFGQALDLADSPQFTDLTLTGNLIVQGTTTTIETTTLLVEDKNIEIGNVTIPTDITADGGGITLKGAIDKTIIWDNATNAWQFNQIALFQNEMSIGSLTAPTTDASLDLKATNKAFMNNGGTTLERDAITPSSRMWWYNTDTNDQEFYNGTSWQSMGGGDVVGPAGSTDNALVRFNGITGKNIQDSNIIIDDLDNMTGITSLGIGTTTPDEILHINNSGGNTSIVMERDTDVVTQNSVILWKNPGGSPKWEMGVSGTSVLIGDNDFHIAEDGSTINTRFIIKVGGNVGIGTASPTYQLHLSGDGVDSTGLKIENTASGGKTWGLLPGIPGVTNGGFSIYNFTDSRTDLRIDPDGNVGIGTSSPDGLLNVFSGSAGTVTARSGGDELVIENSAGAGMSILTP
ncbi:hypothetical protein LCGC14_2006860, partial [marine sediment metagenome]